MTAIELLALFSRYAGEEDIAAARVKNADFVERESLYRLEQLRAMWRKLGVEPKP